MNLHKWGANHPELLAFENKGITEYSFSDQPECESVKTLGVLWNTLTDCFLFKIELHEKDSYTKRDVLSLISRIFDPLGLIGPVITKAKIYLQKLWLLKIDWYQMLPDCIEKNWIDFVSTLPELKNLAIPRYVFREESIVIHGFADASLMAYGAAIYVQSIPTDGIPTARLLCSKSRVAPLKSLTIPRLELSSCLLLAQLMHKVLPSLKIPIEKVILWTDSMICLAWIGKSPHVLKTFVSNRIAAIQELTESYEWRHISSEENPADIISRGLDAKDILTCKLWWDGPSFLREEGPPDKNNSVELDSNNDYISEFKTTIDSNFATLNSNSFVNNFLNLSNNYLKLIHVLSFIFRFIGNARKDQIRVVGPITLEELRRAELFLIREVQGGEFFSEIASIKKGAQISPRSKLKALNVFLDKDGLLRVGSRIAHAQVSYNSKYPIILPARHELTRMIMLHHHLKYFHLGSQALLNTVRQKFWPVSGRNLARKIVHDCVICCKQSPVSVTQVMGNLPIERVVPNFTFNKSGLDFCGPFFIRSNKSRKGSYQKMYVAVFVCFATRAIHLEIVSDLSSEALIACLKRFFARRGKCSTIFSDNATNFRGACNELKKLFKLVNTQEPQLLDYLLLEEVEWKFIPPRAPHFGGIWEAGVKAFKTHLKKTIGDSKLTLEEFLTLVTQIEGMLNSRPITPLSSDSKDFKH
ncbi:uncharacterized protein [Parasteatoda tepidariorum]|uniref:uncharacterized protein n=1 Tax=Parasteatoda tepidariorum TaxID=114398 RepID=UPI0039BC77AF